MSLAKLTAKKLSDEETRTLVKLYAGRLHEHCHPQKVLLFGSAARKEMTEASDLDFIVLFRSQEDLKRAKKAYYSAKRSSSEWPVDVLFLLSDYYAEKKEIGGVCMICDQEGVEIPTKLGDLQL